MCISAGSTKLGTDFRMASRRAATAKADWRTLFRQSIARSLVIAAAVALGLFTLFLTLAFLTHDGTDAAIPTRSEARRLGKAWGNTCIYRWAPYHSKKKKQPN